MPKQEWDGTERGRSFDDQVEQAAVWTAAQAQVEQQRRTDVRRAALRGATLAFFAALILLIPSVAVVGHVISSNATDNAQRNCETQAVGRPVGNIRAFTVKRILDLADAAFSQYAPKVQSAAVAWINGQITKDANQFTGALGYKPDGQPRPIPPIRHFKDLGAFITYLPTINCAHQVQ